MSTGIIIAEVITALVHLLMAHQEATGMTEEEVIAEFRKTVDEVRNRDPNSLPDI